MMTTIKTAANAKTILETNTEGIFKTYRDETQVLLEDESIVWDAPAFLLDILQQIEDAVGLENKVRLSKELLAEVFQKVEDAQAAVVKATEVIAKGSKNLEDFFLVSTREGEKLLDGVEEAEESMTDLKEQVEAITTDANDNAIAHAEKVTDLKEQVEKVTTDATDNAIAQAEKVEATSVQKRVYMKISAFSQSIYRCCSPKSTSQR
jgi:hypothetical protein